MIPICQPTEGLGAGRPMDVTFFKAPKLKNSWSDFVTFLRHPTWKNLVAGFTNSWWAFVSIWVAGIMGPNSLCEFENNELYYRLS